MKAVVITSSLIAARQAMLGQSLPRNYLAIAPELAGFFLRSIGS